MKPIQPANHTNTQNKGFDENSSVVTKKPDQIEKRGPGRPKGSTNKGTEQKHLIAQQQQQQSNDLIKGMYNISFSIKV